MSKSLEQYRKDIKKARRVARQTGFTVESKNSASHPERDANGRFPSIVLRYSCDSRQEVR